MFGRLMSLVFRSKSPEHLGATTAFADRMHVWNAARREAEENPTTTKPDEEERRILRAMELIVLDLQDDQPVQEYVRAHARIWNRFRDGAIQSYDKAYKQMNDRLDGLWQCRLITSLWTTGEFPVVTT